MSILFILFSLIGICQDKPVKLVSGLERTSETEFAFYLEAKLQDGWWLYADNPTEEIAGVQVYFEEGDVQPLQMLFTKGKPIDIVDPVFGKKMKAFKNTVIWTQRVRVNGNGSVGMARIEAFIGNGKEFLPISEKLKMQVAGLIDVAEPNNSLMLSSIKLDAPVNDCGEEQQGEKGIGSIFLLGFMGGLIALLTPCVFPMLPVTISFFTHQSASRQQGIRNGILYGLFIVLIYLAASTPFHLLGNINPEILNTISTNAWVNVAFFFIFLFFALSFFGLFEIKLPSALANTAGKKSGLKSTGGIFFMALTLATVSFSCTGPILGSLLVGSMSSSGGAWQLTAGMGGFGLALALPFALFAMFPQWLKALPKSGGWMETVKKSLAFVELALAIKFLSNADLVEHWGILKREVFIGLWLVIAIGLVLYLFGVFDNKNERLVALHNADKVPPKKNGWPRKVIAISVFAFALYLVPGVTQTKYANLKLLSGFAPPLSYSVYGKDNVQGKGIEPDVINDYEKALALSRQTGKPMLIDFTGWACVNCRKMEEQVWTKPEIKAIIEEKFILVSLYVDDRKNLPAAERFTHVAKDGTEKYIKTMGDKWATFQAENFKQVTQPLYVVLNQEEQLLNHPVGYTPDVKEYAAWLNCGAAANGKGMAVVGK